MLVLEVICYNHANEQCRRLRGLLASSRVSRRRAVVGYWVTLFGDDSRPLARAHLADYAPWTEPVISLVARALNRVELSPIDEWGAPYRSVTLTVFDVGMVPIQKLDVTLDAADGVTNVEGIRVSAPWSVVRWACMYEAFRAWRAPPLPKPLTPDVHHWRGVPYCRKPALTDDVDQAVERRLKTRPRPQIPGAPDAVFPWDMYALLAEPW